MLATHYDNIHLNRPTYTIVVILYYKTTPLGTTLAFVSPIGPYYIHLCVNGADDSHSQPSILQEAIYQLAYEV